ncbi:hypothetical protein AQUCO_17200002v1 [Aquilegia coerulea]|uniref:Uncharacterized protein n=1 Tax=Aquilegia coerulea TaxID=218851 RepID=A0A2G5C0R3_AQUCA|nr:hypothetical protein AQUCO_17200002v1 [Aquilegia coerulea]
MGKRKRNPTSIDSVLRNCIGDLPLGARKRIQRLNRQNRMHVLRNKRAATANANTPSQSNPVRMPSIRTRGRDRRVQSNPIPMRENRIRNHGVRAKRALFQDPIHNESNCLSRRIDVDGYENALPPYDPDSDSDHSINGITPDFTYERQDDSDSKITRG